MEKAQSKSVAPGANPELSPSSSPPHHLPKVRWNLAHFIAMIAFGLGLLTAAALILCYGQVSNALKEVMTSLQEHTIQGEKQDQQLSAAVTELQNQTQQQKIALINLQQLSTGNVAIWRFAEAKYLVQLANYHLTFTRDVPAALALLQTAEQRIATINDPTLLHIRQLIANSIVELQAVPKLDLAGLLTRITALQVQTIRLPAIGLPPPEITPEEQKPENLARSPLRKAINDSWVTLQKIVVIRRQDEQIQPLLSPEQQTYLQQNLQLILQQAQWAALRGQEDVYQSSLNQAQKWVEHYFAGNLPATQAFIRSIGDLKKIHVQPPLPDLAPLALAVQQVTLKPTKKQDS